MNFIITLEYQDEFNSLMCVLYRRVFGTFLVSYKYEGIVCEPLIESINGFIVCWLKELVLTPLNTFTSFHLDSIVYLISIS